jgi:hypothetical protein
MAASRVESGGGSGGSGHGRFYVAAVEEALSQVAPVHDKFDITKGRTGLRLALTGASLQSNELASATEDG